MSGLIVAAGRIAAAGLAVAAVAGCAASHAQVTDTRRPAVASHARALSGGTHARRLPGIYLGAGAGPWAGPKVRPRTLLLGADWTLGKLRWTDWSLRHADGRGYYVACQGAAGPCDKFWATIAASDVRDHAGSRYFAVMKLTRRNGHIIWLVMNTKLGWWQKSGRP